MPIKERVFLIRVIKLGIGERWGDEVDKDTEIYVDKRPDRDGYRRLVKTGDEYVSILKRCHTQGGPITYEVKRLSGSSINDDLDAMRAHIGWRPVISSDHYWWS